jgi:hypothetical protein
MQAPPEPKALFFYQSQKKRNLQQEKEDSLAHGKIVVDHQDEQLPYLRQLIEPSGDRCLNPLAKNFRFYQDSSEKLLHAETARGKKAQSKTIHAVYKYW